ncbi:hypothetical protein FGG08_002369 [Glutinoglossum americanum]|uniref:Uncharacterized protein n=1 Tax=Glutinoglossum americanum TaxID=1670608 RepID=A0A9P8KZ90_9PEZI|nr:hypothetical protein FGG08_002369 [Glutinoglossum americanum]
MNRSYIHAGYLTLPVYVPVPNPFVVAVQARPHLFRFYGPRNPATLPVPPAAAPTPASDDVPPGSRFNGGLPPETLYLYPIKHTTIHVFRGDFDPLAEPLSEFSCWALKVPITLTVSELIYQLGARTGGDDKCGVTEFFEIGDGSWAEGVSIFQIHDQKSQTLVDIGWNETRGTTQEPVWLKLHKG